MKQKSATDFSVECEHTTESYVYKQHKKREYEDTHTPTFCPPVGSLGQ